MVLQFFGTATSCSPSVWWFRLGLLTVATLLSVKLLKASDLEVISGAWGQEGLWDVLPAGHAGSVVGKSLQGGFRATFHSAADKRGTTMNPDRRLCCPGASCWKERKKKRRNNNYLTRKKSHYKRFIAPTSKKKKPLITVVLELGASPRPPRC